MNISFFPSINFFMHRLGIYRRQKSDVAKNLLHDNVYIVYCIRESEEDAFDDITTNTSSCVSFVVVCFHCQSFGCDGLCLWLLDEQKRTLLLVWLLVITYICYLSRKIRARKVRLCLHKSAIICLMDISTNIWLIDRSF